MHFSEERQREREREREADAGLLLLCGGPRTEDAERGD